LTGAIAMDSICFACIEKGMAGELRLMALQWFEL
jgi:hypothetical protein